MSTTNTPVLPVGYNELFPVASRMVRLLEQYYQDLTDSGCQYSRSAFEIEQLMEHWQKIIRQDKAWNQQFKQQESRHD